MYFLSFPFDMIILPYLHPIKASDVANHGLSRIKGWPPKFYFGCRTRKSTRYFEESKETMIYSSTPSRTTLDLSTSSKIMAIGGILGKFKHFLVSIVFTLITNPK